MKTNITKSLHWEIASLGLFQTLQINHSAKRKVRYATPDLSCAHRACATLRNARRCHFFFSMAFLPHHRLTSWQPTSKENTSHCQGVREWNPLQLGCFRFRIQFRILHRQLQLRLRPQRLHQLPP